MMTVVIQNQCLPGTTLRTSQSQNIQYVISSNLDVLIYSRPCPFFAFCFFDTNNIETKNNDKTKATKQELVKN